MRRPRLQLATLLLLLGAPAAAQQRGELLDRVADVLLDRYYDGDFRQEELPALAERYRAAAVAARSLDEERAVVHGFLAEIPISHLALYSRATHRELMRELQNRSAPTLGFQLVQHRGRFFVSSVLEGGPAARAGLRRGDRVLAIDGVPPGRSSRLDWRSDDSHLDDPPLHAVLCEDGDVVELEIERAPGRARALEIEAADYSAFEAARHSVRVIEHDGLRLGHVHFWFMHMGGVPKLLREALREDFAVCDGLVLDARGRGGSPMAVMGVLDVLERHWDRPAVMLVDRASRSAKEVLSYEVKKRGLARLVGERTAGAVIPATFTEVGQDSVLMFPSMTLGKYTRAIEGVGVEPDVHASSPVPYSAGADPILEAGLRELARMAVTPRAAGQRSRRPVAR